MSNITEDQAQAAWQRIEKGESSVIAEARALGFKDRILLRRAIIALVGQTKYAAVAQRNDKSRQ